MTHPSSRTESSSQQRAGLWVVPDAQLDAFITPQEREQFAVIAPARTYDKGERLFRQGDICDGFFVVVAGRVKLSVPGSVGGERVLAFCGEGELFGCVTGEGGLHHSEAVAMADGTQVVAVTHTQYFRVAQQVPAVAVAITRVQAQRVQALEEQLERAQLPVQARLAHTLLDLTRRFGLNGGDDVAGAGTAGDGLVELLLDFHHDEFASLAGTTRVRATQALSAWRSMDLVRGTRGAYTVNVPGLQALLELLEAEQFR
jgi:CRP/FNR family transcriptional regulator, cyclic AMP receptor protein